MNSKIVAGQFETDLASLIAEKLTSGAQLDAPLVGDCYMKVVRDLSLKASPADDLHIQEILELLKQNEPRLRTARAGTMARIIFDLIYMH